MFKKRKKDIEDGLDPWDTSKKPSPSQRASNGDGDLGIRLRQEMLPASQVSPRFKAYPKPIITPRRILTLLLVMALAGLGWYFGVGPGRPGLERGLAVLVRLARDAAAPTPTPLPTETPSLPIATVILKSSSTPWPTLTSTPMIPTNTPTPSFTETPESACRDFSTVSLDEIGVEMCIQGTVINVIEDVDNTLLIFSDQTGALYLVTYDVDWPDGTIGTCYQVTGEIERLLSSPVIVFDYHNLPTECP